MSILLKSGLNWYFTLDVEDLKKQIKDNDEAKKKDDLKEEFKTKLNHKKLVMKFLL